jgi:hypothetical protein
MRRPFGSPVLAGVALVAVATALGKGGDHGTPAWSRDGARIAT